MTRISRSFARLKMTAIVLALLLASLSSMTGCSRRYVVVDADKPASISQGEADRLYQDNELLMQALEECRGGK
jgi:hypothetical protein